MIASVRQSQTDARMVNPSWSSGLENPDADKYTMHQ